MRLVRPWGPLEGADVAVTTREGGVSVAPYDQLNLADHVGDDPRAVAENRRRLAATLGVRPDALAIARQVHGAAVAHAAPGAVLGDADALVTTEPSVVLCTLVADCVPIALVDAAAQVLATVHAGWRGVRDGVVTEALSAMLDAGAAPDRVRALLGPCISARAYQVGDDVADALDAAGLGHVVVPDGTGRFLADLAEGVTTQLERGGVPRRHVVAPFAVTDGGATYFSDRARRPCGRFALVARLVRN